VKRSDQTSVPVFELIHCRTYPCKGNGLLLDGHQNYGYIGIVVIALAIKLSLLPDHLGYLAQSRHLMFYVRLLVAFIQLFWQSPLICD
jgi:hypothetical protein